MWESNPPLKFAGLPCSPLTPIAHYSPRSAIIGCFATMTIRTANITLGYFFFNSSNIAIFNQIGNVLLLVTTMVKF
jgi:hypothetical protein